MPIRAGNPRPSLPGCSAAFCLSANEVFVQSSKNGKIVAKLHSSGLMMVNPVARCPTRQSL